MAKIMRTGMLNTQLTLRKPVVSRNDYGEEVAAWADGATVWGNIRYTTGRENITDGRVVSSSEAVITIRYRRGLTAKWRLTGGGRTFRIIAPPEDVDMRHEWTVLKCMEVSGG